MVVPAGGFRPANGLLLYHQTGDNYELSLMDIRSRMLEAQDIRTRQTYVAGILNYGNVQQEMFSERDVYTKTPSSNQAYTSSPDPDVTTTFMGPGNYKLKQGTPLFAETMYASNTRYVGLVANASTANVINYGTNQADVFSDLYVGQQVEINGEMRTVTAYTAPGAAPGQITVNPPLSQAPPLGSLLLIKGRDVVNPHLNEIYRVTDKYSSLIVDQNRYQVDRNEGIVRYRPDAGTLATSIWHPGDTGAANQNSEPFYFGRLMNVKIVPPAAGPSTDGILNNEELGAPDDSVATGLNGASLPTVLTSFVRPGEGQFSNIRITAPAGVYFEVELNGAKIAISHNGGQLTIPFFDPNHQNDQLKANEGIDPDIYIQRFIEAGTNTLAIKAVRTATATGNSGIRVEGTFNGVNLATNNSPTSVNTLDWSTSRHSILGIAGKIEFQLGDRIALEDVNDEIQKAQGVLESLTTIIAGTDVNQFQSILSVIR